MFPKILVVANERHGECKGNYIGRGGFESHRGSHVPILVADVSLKLVAMINKGEKPETMLVLREWSCRFEACSVVASHPGGPAGRVGVIVILT